MGTSQCGAGTRTRVRNALGEEGSEVEQGVCRGDCGHVDGSNDVLPPTKPFLPFFSSELFAALVPGSPTHTPDRESGGETDGHDGGRRGGGDVEKGVELGQA